MKQETKEYIQELYQKYGEIEIKCDGSNYLPIDSILDFQGDLKKLSDKDLRRLVKSIFIHGFIAPFFTFDDAGDKKLLDGHSRSKAFLAIRESGIQIPGQFPVIEIQATSEKQAREYLLAITSQYGQFQKSVLDDWVADLDAEIAESLRIVDTEMELAIAELAPPNIEMENNEIDIDKDPTGLVKLTVAGITREEAGELAIGYISKGYEVNVK